MHIQELPLEYVIVLQQIGEDGGDSFEDLADTLQIDRSRLSHIVEALRHKGYVHQAHGAMASRWMELSSKGRRFINYLWPEAGLHPSY